MISLISTRLPNNSSSGYFPSNILLSSELQKDITGQSITLASGLINDFPWPIISSLSSLLRKDCA